MTVAIQRPDIDAWRDRWESDPAITYRKIAESTSVTVATLRGYAVRRGWVRTPDVHREMLRIAAAAGCAARYGKGCNEADGPASDAPPAVASSIWAMADGRLVSTVRRGGKHVEVNVAPGVSGIRPLLWRACA